MHFLMNNNKIVQTSVSQSDKLDIWIYYDYVHSCFFKFSTKYIIWLLLEQIIW